MPLVLMNGNEPYFESGGVQVFHGDCIEVMRELPAESVHAIVTDPPYGIAFMGKQWDQPGEFGSQRKAPRPTNSEVRNGGPDGAMEAGRYDLSPTAMHNFQSWCEAWARECLRVLKPGGHMLVSGSPRTWHRLVVGIEDAGFEIRDSIAWLYGSGFPKSLDVSKAIDKAAGAVREVVSEGKAVKRMIPGADQNTTGSWIKDNGREFVPTVSAAETADAKVWEGWGTALKPAFEPIVVARKPFSGTVASNVVTHGTGGLNIDATRTGTEPRMPSATGLTRASRGEFLELGERTYVPSPEGRWPMNVVLDESQAAELDNQTGILTSGANPTRRGSDKFRNTYGEFKGQVEIEPARGAESGGASRFFPTFRYEAKAPQSERPEQGGVQHPTVKPLDLIRWLVRLVTPPEGIVLEPFAGSGTTVEACLLEGFSCVAIEREAAYLPLIVQRIGRDHQQSLFAEDAS